jgi:UDP-N-acetylmuramoyl-L-alanyl-D-glutamate--2,6-diaminopimelate ligase
MMKKPEKTMRVIAVTGTSGKTTTSWLTASVLAEAGLRVGVISDLGCLDAFGMDTDAGRVEDAASLAQRLAGIEESGCTHAVVEVSGRLLAAGGLTGMGCDTVVVTNLAGPGRRQRDSRSADERIDGLILDALADDGCLIVNADDPRLKRLVGCCGRERPAAGVVTAGLKGGDLAASPVERGLSGQTFLLQAGGHVMPVAVVPPVASFVRDALLAAAVGVRYRVPLERAARGIEAAGCVSGRMERLDRGQDFAVFLDAPTSGHALAGTLAGLRRLTRGRLVLVADERIAAALGGEGRFVIRSSRWCDDCIVAPPDIAADEAGGRAAAAYGRIDRVLDDLEQGDCLLVLGDLRHCTGPRGRPAGGRLGLVDVVDGWLQLAHRPRQAARRVA